MEPPDTGAVACSRQNGFLRLSELLFPRLHVSRGYAIICYNTEFCFEQEGGNMKEKPIVVAAGTVLLILLLAVASLAQTARCVILEKSDTVVTVGCPGGSTEAVNIGGRADLYQPGDSIDISEPPRISEPAGRRTSAPQHPTTPSNHR